MRSILGSVNIRFGAVFLIPSSLLSLVSVTGSRPIGTISKIKGEGGDMVTFCLDGEELVFCLNLWKRETLVMMQMY